MNPRIPGTDSRSKGRQMEFWRGTTLVQARIAAARLREQPPDCLIGVPVQTIGLFDFHRTAEATAAGHTAAR